MTVKHLYPNSTPALNLNPKSSRVADPRIACVRNSVGTYVDPVSGLIKTAAAHEARVGKDGLLVEEARTNLAEHSQEFEDSFWNAKRFTPDDNQALAPDGTMTAATLMETAVDSSHVFNFAGNVSGNTSYAQTIFVKANGRDYVGWNVNDAANQWITAIFDLSNGTFVDLEGGSGFQNITHDIQSAGNGWYRIALSYASGPHNLRTNRLIGLTSDNPTLSLDNGAEQYLGETSKGYYIWGGQLEQDSFPTSYIPTSGSTVTRNADEASITGTNFSSWYNTGGEGTLVTTANGAVAGTSFNFSIVYLGGGASSGNNRISSTIGSTFTAFAQTTSLGVSIAGAVYTSNVDGNGAFGYKSGDSALYVDGSSVGTSSGTTIPTTTVDRMYIGMNRGRTNQINGDTSRIAYYPTRLSNTQLQALSQ